MHYHIDLLTNYALRIVKKIGSMFSSANFLPSERKRVNSFFQAFCCIFQSPGSLNQVEHWRLDAITRYVFVFCSYKVIAVPSHFFLSPCFSVLVSFLSLSLALVHYAFSLFLSLYHTISSSLFVRALSFSFSLSLFLWISVSLSLCLFVSLCSSALHLFPFSLLFSPLFLFLSFPPPLSLSPSFQIYYSYSPVFTWTIIIIRSLGPRLSCHQL